MFLIATPLDMDILKDGTPENSDYFIAAKL